nr:ABC transporter ATP-binding protein [Croceicoccus bisphenolivorans]
MSSVRLEGIAKRFGSTEVIRGVDLDIKSGEFVVFVGASGSGKSTLLRMIAGLEQPSEGQVFIGDSDVTDAPPSQRGVSMVFQSYALYPHMTVRDNIAFGLKLKKAGKAAIEEAVTRVATMLEIEGLLDRKPGQLSGGQRQRVAIARAIVREPDVFLFDEPLSNLDAALRTRTRIEIKDLHRKLQATMIYVTHDQIEAMSLADRMVILNGGHIEQVGPPAVLYHEPATKYVAAFLGSPSMNFLPPELAGSTEAAEIGIRPEDVRVAASGLPATIEEIEELGETRVIHARLESGDPVALRDRDLADPHIGQNLSLEFDRERVHHFDADGKRMPG